MHDGAAAGRIGRGAGGHREPRSPHAREPGAGRRAERRPLPATIPTCCAAQPRSVIATPLVNQGRLLGVVYLENNLATGVFTPERLALIQVVASQAAIAIQNAQLYLGLKREVADRTRMEPALRTISEGTAALTGLDFFRTVARLAAETLGHPLRAGRRRWSGRGTDRVTTLAFWQDGTFGENVSYALAGTPCEAVIAGQICHHPQRDPGALPRGPRPGDLDAEGYLGVPLLGVTGMVVGHIALIHDGRSCPSRRTWPCSGSSPPARAPSWSGSARRKRCGRASSATARWPRRCPRSCTPTCPTAPATT